MSQVMGYSFPNGSRLRCDNPICDELANKIAKITTASGDSEICGCSAHFDAMCIGRPIVSMVSLTTPGERNPS